MFRFHDAIFTGRATFGRATFRSFVSFARNEFALSPHFLDAIFQSLANFNDARFLSGVSFENSKFGMDARFADVVFGDATSFSGCNFDQQVTFRSSKFKTKTPFEREVFRTQVQSFFESELCEYTDWYGAKWPDVPDNAADARSQVQHSQRLVLLMNELHRPDDNHFFFRRELRARRRTERMSISTAMNWLYEFVCDYGHGPGRVASIWLLHIVVGAALIWSSKVVSS